MKPFRNETVSGAKHTVMMGHLLSRTAPSDLQQPWSHSEDAHIVQFVCHHKFSTNIIQKPIAMHAAPGRVMTKDPVELLQSMQLREKNVTNPKCDNSTEKLDLSMLKVESTQSLNFDPHAGTCNTQSSQPPLIKCKDQLSSF